MKLGSSAEPFRVFGAERYTVMKKYGFDYADICVDDEGAEALSDEEYRQRYRDEKALADKAGVLLHQVHGPWRYPPHDETPELRAGRMAWMQRSIRATAEVGVKNWVIHPLMPFGAEQEFDKEAFWSINEAFFRELLVTAKQCDVTICFENMPMAGLSMSPPAQTLAFIRQINDEHFRFCLDTGHCAVLGVRPGDAVRAAGKDLQVLHVHDNSGKRDDHWVPCTGVIDWTDFRDALRETGFGGVYSLECNTAAFLPHAPEETRIQCLAAVVRSITD